MLFVFFYVFVLLSLDCDLYSFFSQLFSVTLAYNVEWLIKEFNSLAGFCFVSFDSEDTVDKICDLQFHHIDGNKVRNSTSPKFVCYNLWWWGRQPSVRDVKIVSSISSPAHLIGCDKKSEIVRYFRGRLCDKMGLLCD